MKTQTHPAPNHILSQIVLLGLLLAVGRAQAADVVKANNADDLNLGSSWVGGAPPTPTDVGVWNNTVAGANSTLLGASTNWAGIRISNPGGTVFIGTNNILTLSGSGIDLSSASQDLILSNALTLNAIQPWTLAANRTLTIGGTLARTAGSAIRFGLADVSTSSVIIAGTPSAMLLNGNVTFGTVNDTDFAARDGSMKIVGGGTLSIYTLNPAAATPSLAGTINAVVDMVNDTAGSYGFRLSNTMQCYGVRVNAPHASNPVWEVRLDSNRVLTMNSILVTTNSGTDGLNFTASGFVRIGNSGSQELLIFQNNPNAPVTFLNTGGISQQGTGILTKMGVGLVDIAVNATHGGGTRIYEGSLRVSAAGKVGTGALTVFGGKFIGANGANITPSSTTFNNGATNTIQIQAANGQFIVTNLVTYGTGSTWLEFNYSTGIGPSATTAAFLVSGNLTNNGTLNISVLSGNLSVGQFPLVRYTGTLGGAGTLNLLAYQPHTSAFLSNNVANSSIDLVVTSVNQPLRWAAGSGIWDLATANWKDNSGATTTYQQVGSIGDNAVFEDTQSGSSPIAVTLNTPINPASVTASNATKDYSITGSGNISGNTTVTKLNGGTLTLQTANTFTGTLGLNGGTTVFSAPENLGSSAAPISFGGGTLQYAAANTADISAHTVTFATGGGTIDVGASSVSYANPIGNNGAGGLTKTGSGTLTLNGTNRFNGNTLVSQGTLALGSPNTYISNSPNITVNSGTILDASASGLVLNGLASQVLAGSGTVNGNVTVGTGTSITPGTSVGTLALGNDLTLSGGTYVFEVSTNPPSDLINVTGNLTISGGTIQVVASTALTNGAYRLINYTGTLSGSAGSLIISGFTQPGKVAFASDAAPGQINLVVATAGGSSIVWQGNGTNWDVETSFNWLNGAVSTQYINGDLVTFNNTGIAQPNVNLATAVLPGSVTVDSTSDYTFSTLGSGRLSGSTGLTKNNSAKLTVLTPNNNTGPTVINGGTLQIGDGVTTGDLGTGHITNNSTLVFQQTDNRSVNGVVSGAGSLFQNGVSTLTLNNAVPYTGPTTIGSGATLQVGNGGAGGAMSTSSITNDGTLILNSSASWTYANGIRGTGLLVKSGTGALSLGGVVAYDGNTFVSNGVLRITAAEKIPDGGTSSGWLILDGSAGSVGTFDLNGFNETVNALAGLNGTVNGLITNSGTTGTNTLTVGSDLGSDTACFARIAENSTGAKLAVVKKGSSAQTLSGANSYSGGTIVQAGTFRLQNTTAAGTGSIVLSNGTTISINTAPGNNSVFPNNDLITPPDATITMTANNLANGYNNLFFGSNTSTNLVTAAVSCATTVYQFSNFFGTVLVNGGAEFRFSATGLNFNGGDYALFQVDGTIETRNGNGGGPGVSLGALSGAGVIGGPQTPPGNTTWIIGARGMDTTFSGTINGNVAGSVNNIVKTGVGTLTLDGTLNYTGTTTVSNGVLVLGGSAELDDSPTINVAAGVLDVNGIGGTLNIGLGAPQTLSGSGTVRGSVNVGNGTVSPGNGIGTLTVTNLVTLSATSSNIMELNRTNTPSNSDRLVAQGGFAITAGAALIVNNIGPTNFTAGDTFQLFNQPVTNLTIVGSLPPLPCAGLQWTNKLQIDGSLAVIGTPCMSTTPTNISFAITGNSLSLSWPASHTGWDLQTNGISVANPAAWFSVPGSTGTNQVTVIVDRTKTNVFYRLRLP